MFRFLARQTYKNMSAEDFIRQLAEVRATTIAAFSGVSGPSQLNKLAEIMVKEHWDWCRATKDPLGGSLTLSALGLAVSVETVALATKMPSADVAVVIEINDKIWEILESRGLVDDDKVDKGMPERIKNRIYMLLDLMSTSR